MIIIIIVITDYYYYYIYIYTHTHTYFIFIFCVLAFFRLGWSRGVWKEAQVFECMNTSGLRSNIQVETTRRNDMT